MKTFCTILAILSFPAAIWTQSANLVKNPGFEQLLPGQKADKVTPLTALSDWDSPTLGAPQLFTTVNGNIYDPHGSLWPFKAHSGYQVAGINVYGGSERVQQREYLQGSLTRPLTVGKKYYFSFYVHYHCEGANNIGIAFLPEKTNKEVVGLLPLQAVSYQRSVTKYNNRDHTWTLVRDSFVAVKPYTFFVIGNFLPNDQTEIEDNGYSHHFAFIDDIEVVEAPDAAVDINRLDAGEKQKWNQNTVLSNPANPVSDSLTVLFEFDSDKLSASGKNDLDALLGKIDQQTSFVVYLSGHASSEGSEAYNTRLSARRAAAIQQYLLKKGLHADQIQIEALGESQPVASNDTPEGRRANRRVRVWVE